MEKKALVISVITIVLIVLASWNPVVGTTFVKSDAEKGIASPLFAVRAQRSVHKEEIKKVHANYLGKGRILNLFF